MGDLCSPLQHDAIIHHNSVGMGSYHKLDVSLSRLVVTMLTGLRYTYQYSNRAVKDLQSCVLQKWPGLWAQTTLYHLTKHISKLEFKWKKKQEMRTQQVAQSDVQTCLIIAGHYSAVNQIIKSKPVNSITDGY